MDDLQFCKWTDWTEQYIWGRDEFIFDYEEGEYNYFEFGKICNIAFEPGCRHNDYYHVAKVM